MSRAPDPYQTLGVRRSATDAELRVAYRRLVQLHHPDHNGGSAESARRFEEVQEAYAEVRRRRQAGGAGGTAAREAAPAPSADHVGGVAGAPAGAGAAAGAGSGDESDLDARLAAMERDLKAAREAGKRAVREARRAEEQTLRDVREMAGGGSERPSDEELGYFSTDDSFAKILDDAAAGFSERLTEARKSQAAHRVSDLIDELTAKLTGEPPERH
jgi:curved DNA-binding protein CbpA